MLPRIYAGSPKAMQQVDIVQSRMSLRCSRGKCNYILAPSCAHSLLEKKINIIFLFFQPLVYVHNQMFKCRLLITFENSSGPTKCSRENACMCRLVSAFAAQEKMFCFFFRNTCFGRTYTKIGTIQRRLAWPLRKDDTQIREAFHIFLGSREPRPKSPSDHFSNDVCHELRAMCLP